MIKNWYNNLQAQEQKIVLYGGIIASILILYIFIWSPLVNGLDNARKTAETQQETLTWMKTASAKIKSLQQNSAANTNAGRSLLSIIDENVQSSGLKTSLQRMEPEGTDSVKLWFNQTSFNVLIVMLGRLETNYGVHIKLASLNPTESSGLVDARITLSTNPAAL